MNTSSIPKKNLLLLIFIGTLLICLPLSYFTIARKVDAFICIPRVAQKFGVEPDLTHVYQYAREQINPGMREQKVMEILREMGPIEKRESTVLANGKIREGMVIRICLHPMNQIHTEAYYNKDRILTSFYIIEDPLN